MTDPTKKVYQLVGTRIDAGTMPPPPNTLAASDKSTLDAWIQAGAPAGSLSQVCLPPDAGVYTQGAGPEYLPCTPKYTFTAHDPLDRTQGFTVPTGGSHNFYECFAFKAPFAPGEQGTAFAPIIDKKAELHHWILWESTTSTHADGDVFICGAVPDAQSKFLAGWAPGGHNFVMPNDVLVITPFPTYNGGMMVCPVPGLPSTWL